MLTPAAYLLYSAKKHATDQGGKIVHEYTLIKGFSYVSTRPRLRIPISCFYADLNAY